MPDYVKTGIFRVPGNVIVDPKDEYALVFGLDGTFKIVADPFSGSPVEVSSFDSVGGLVAKLMADTTIAAGAGTALAKPAGVIHVNTTAAPTTGTTEEILATYALPAGTLNVDGRAIRITAWASTAANANSKTFRVRFGGIGAAANATHTTAASGRALHLQAIIVRTGAATQEATGVGFGAATEALQTEPTQTLANAIDIVVTGQTPTAASDLTFQGLLVEILN